MEILGHLVSLAKWAFGTLIFSNLAFWQIDFQQMG